MLAGRLQRVGAHATVTRHEIRRRVFARGRGEQPERLVGAFIHQRQLRLDQVSAHLQVPRRRWRTALGEDATCGVRPFGEHEGRGRFEPVTHRRVARGELGETQKLLGRRQVLTALHVRPRHARRLAVRLDGTLRSGFAGRDQHG